MRKPRGNGSSPRGPQESGVAGLFVVPRLEELAADPSRAGVLDTRTARIVATQALGIFMASFCRLLEAGGADNLSDEAGQVAGWRDGPSNSSRILPELDDVVSVEEIAGILGKPPRWIISERLALAVRDPCISEALRLFQDCTETMACVSATRA
jgi:hypothetical protein